MKKRKVETFFIWVCALIILYFITYLDFFWLNKFIFEKEKNLTKQIASLKEEISENNKITFSISENQLNNSSLISSPILIDKIHHAFGENNKTLSLDDITQNSSTPELNLANMQEEQLHGKSILKFIYTIKVKGDYLSLLDFSRIFSQEKNIFIESMTYQVNTYPESLMTLKLRVYDLS